MLSVSFDIKCKCRRLALLRVNNPQRISALASFHPFSFKSSCAFTFLSHQTNEVLLFVMIFTCLVIPLFSVPEEYKCGKSLGPVESLQEHQKNSDKILIGYSRGLVVLWDLNSRHVDNLFLGKQVGGCAQVCSMSLTWLSTLFDFMLFKGQNQKKNVKVSSYKCQYSQKSHQQIEMSMIQLTLQSCLMSRWFNLNPLAFCLCFLRVFLTGVLCGPVTLVAAGEFGLGTVG